MLASALVRSRTSVHSESYFPPPRAIAHCSFIPVDGVHLNQPTAVGRYRHRLTLLFEALVMLFAEQMAVAANRAIGAGRVT